MSFELKHNTAGQVVPLGQFLDSTDGDTEEPSLTIANTDIRIWKAGATSLVNKNSGGATYMSNGVYYATFDATDTNTLGPLEIFVHVAGALAVHKVCVVRAANVYDSVVANTDLLQTDVTQLASDATAVTNLRDTALTIATGTAITGTLSTTQMSTNLTETTDDHYVGLLLKWKGGALAGQGATITGYNGTTKVLTFTAVTDIPANTDPFTIS